MKNIIESIRMINKINHGKDIPLAKIVKISHESNFCYFLFKTFIQWK
jgi:hypothetical protein